MKRIYTFGHEQVERNITVGDILENKKNNKKMTQVTAANQEEAEIIAGQDVDMIITGSDWYQDVRNGAQTRLSQQHFLLGDLLQMKKYFVVLLT